MPKHGYPICWFNFMILKAKCLKPFSEDYGVFRTATYISGWSIVYIEGSQVIIKKNDCISLKMDFVLENSADTNEMPHYAAFHLGLNCLPKYPFRGF